MLNENALKWVDALRSGKYRQARQRLNDGYGFCCLGVACEVYNQNVPEDQRLPVYPSDSGLGYKYGTDAYILPVVVKEWLGLTTGRADFSPDPINGFMNEGLTGHNDKGETFEQIADIIESEPEGLFNGD